VTGIDLTLNNGIEPQYALFGRSAQAVSWGRSTLSGTLSAFYVDGNIPDMFINDTRVKLEFTQDAIREALEEKIEKQTEEHFEEEDLEETADKKPDVNPDFSDIPEETFRKLF